MLDLVEFSVPSVHTRCDFMLYQDNGKASEKQQNTRNSLTYQINLT